MKTLLVTGGAGFIGSSVVLQALASGQWRVVNVDKLTYSGNLESLASVERHPAYRFVRADVGDRQAMDAIFDAEQPDAVMHLAAESHVDRSIDAPEAFIETNIRGTYTLLEAARSYWKRLQTQDAAKAAGFKFLHISTDEVFGDLADGNERYFHEGSRYAPSSPYSASKAASDHLVRAWQRTYGLPALITNCSNNYGPRQFPEKLIPVTILNALAGRPIPIYGQGAQIRDWLYVEDHADALLLAIANGKPGETYTIGGNCEKRNIDVARSICAVLERLAPAKQAGVAAYSDLITYVRDRPGHDGRYAMDAGKIRRELGWQPRENFASGLEKTVAWYLDNRSWWQRILDGSYRLERQGANI